jgi:CO/xanthine dehydrogenase Mo-binding subunit
MSTHNRPPTIGTSVPRFDAPSKVTGRERYAADYYSGDMLWAGAKRAGIPHALLKSIDTSAAEKVEGVVRVLTWRDVPGANRIGILRQDEPILADRKVRHAGDAVALVIARSRAALAAALRLVAITCEPLPGVFNAEEALRDGSPLVHEEYDEGNLVRYVSVEKGRGLDGLGDCDIIEEAAFDLPRQEHAYLETEAGFSYTTDGGKLVIVASTQTPFRDRREIALALGLNVEDVRVIAPHLGGAFGGKDGITVQCLIGLAALLTKGVAVKMWWDREESFLAGVKGLPARLHYRLGAKRDGTFHALVVKAYFDTGAYASLGGEIMTLALEHAGSCYRIPHTSIEGWCAYTNNPVGGPFRGFGVPQVTAAMEQVVDMIALRVGLDPLSIRLKNGLKEGDKNCIGITLDTSTGILECLEGLQDHPFWVDRQEWCSADAPPFTKRAVGMAAMAHAMGYPAAVPDFANAKIEVTTEGRFVVYAGVSDMGQGNSSTYVQIAGAILNQPPGLMDVILPDTEATLPSGSSSASRTTYVYGNALIEATEILKQRLIIQAARLMNAADRENLRLVTGAVLHEPTGASVSLADVAALMDAQERSATAFYQARAATDQVDRIYLGPHILYSYGAHLAGIEIDLLTGRVDVLRYLAFTDAGRVINPQLYEQQIHGAIAQGIGYALMEDFSVKNGKVATTNLATYIIPSSLDIPDMDSRAVQTEEASGPFGMKGVGEVAISGVLPAIANGLADALGVRLFRAPFTAERVLRAISSLENEEEEG